MTTETMPDVARIQTEIRKAERATEPGSFTPGLKVSDKGDELQGTVHGVQSAGYVTLWNTQTGLSSKFNMNMVPRKLKDKFPDGSYVWSADKPDIEPFRGAVKCFLHPDDPNRAEYDRMGFAACNKANLINEYQRDRHMQRRHKDEWLAIEEARKKRERQEERDFQRGILMASRSTEPAKVVDAMIDQDFTGNVADRVITKLEEEERPRKRAKGTPDAPLYRKGID